MVKLSIPKVQHQTKAGVYNGESHPLVAVPMEFQWKRDSDACRISSVRFRQLGAIVELQLYSSDEALCSEFIRSVTFESETPLAGDFSFDLKTVTVNNGLPISGYESKVATTVLEEPATIPAEWRGGVARVYLTIAPGQYIGQIVIRTHVAQYTFRLKNPMTFERAVIKGLPADLAKAGRIVLSPDGPNDPILFEDSVVKEICVKHWDTNFDGQLSYKEAAAVTDLNGVFGANDITSFNELQYFTGLQSIGSWAFAGCSNLTRINIPDRVTAIGNYAFEGCSNLTRINIPDRVTAIGKGAFRGCSSLTDIHIPDGVTKIGDSAFAGCSSLTSIHIPDGVTEIGERAFWHCSSLTSINIPQTVLSIGERVFANCSSLFAFEGKYVSADHRCLVLNGALLAFAPADLTKYTIPDGVVGIGNEAFYNCSSLTSITIPDGVTAIGESAFEGCSYLTSINIPNGVTAIRNYAFEGCGSLTSIHIPDGVTAIENRAFRSCLNLTSINIPGTVTSIGSEAFYNCCRLTSVSCKRTTPPTLGYSAFSSSSMKIYVPAASVEAYKTAENWSEYASQIVADNN